MAIRLRARWKPNQERYIVGRGETAMLALVGQVIAYDDAEVSLPNDGNAAATVAYDAGDAQTENAIVLIAEEVFTKSIVGLTAQPIAAQIATVDADLQAWAADVKANAVAVQGLIGRIARRSAVRVP